MGRIRSIKPDHRAHRKVGRLSDREYRLWIGMINEADDAGRLICDADQLRALTWAYDRKVRVADVESAIEKLSVLGLIKLYTVKDIRYAAFPSWADHQHPKYPTPSKLPAPPADTDFPQGSPNSPPRDQKSFPTRVVELSREELSREERTRRGESRQREGNLGNGHNALRKGATPKQVAETMRQVRGEHPGWPEDKIQTETRRQLGLAERP